MFQFCLPDFLVGMFGHTQEYDPAAFIFNILVPFLVVAVVAAMEVEYIFRNQDKLCNALRDHRIYDGPFQGFDIVFDRVVSFPDKFYDRKILIIVYEKHL